MSALMPSGDRDLSVRYPMGDTPGSWPLLAQPWAGGMAGWLVAFGTLLADIVAGIVTNPASALVATLVLALPAAVAVGFSVVQYQQVRSCRAEPASWWHLSGIAAAALTWLAYPTHPGVLYGVNSARQACIILSTPTPTADCLARTVRAMDASNVAWWLTGVLILMMALLTRRSRIAAWSAIAVALAGCLIATHFLELLLLYYHSNS